MAYKNVIMMHSVGSNHTLWKERWLSVDKTQFEVFCKFLHDHGYRTHFMDHWYQTNGESPDRKDLYLTFDDGYLDNYLIAYPIMKKYGIKGTIFVNPEFVDSSKGLRTLTNHPSTMGFLNWDEIKFLDKTGVMDIQSHSMSHNFYFSSDKLIDIHDGSNKYHWLAWISRPDRKSQWQLEEQGLFTSPGTPIFESYRALGLRRYFPDEQLVRQSILWYQEGLRGIELMSKVRKLQKQLPGRFETDEEMEVRYHYELADSKKILEEKLGKEISILCWPGGGYNDLSLKIAEEVGYKASTIASKDRLVIFDNSANSYKRIARYGMESNIRMGRYFKPVRKVPTTCNKHLIYAMKYVEKDPKYYFWLLVNNFIMRFF